MEIKYLFKHAALKNYTKDQMEKLLETSTQEERYLAFLRVCQFYDPDYVSLFDKYNIDIAYHDDKGYSGLYYALCSNNKNKVKYLIDNHVKYCSTDKTTNDHFYFLIHKCLI